MPLPVYILCSESGSEDKETGLLSLFNVIDKLRVNTGAMPMPLTAAPITQLRITAVWMREQGDDGNEFEFEVIFRPPKGDEIKAMRGTFSFAMPLYRIIARVIGMFPIQGEGVLWIENRVRKVGAGGWRKQESPIFIEQFAFPAQPAANAADTPLERANEHSETESGVG
jgi:hypothetical protein